VLVRAQYHTPGGSAAAVAYTWLNFDTVSSSSPSAVSPRLPRAAANSAAISAARVSLSWTSVADGCALLCARGGKSLCYLKEEAPFKQQEVLRSDQRWRKKPAHDLRKSL
jgi:hypothetical protein